MAIFAMGDLHLSLGTNKPMDIFKGWDDYVQRIEENWRREVGPDDTVVLIGDISWAMSLQEAVKDFSFINDLPGKKIISKGNHDYWWTTLSKMNKWLEENSFDTISFLHNNSFAVEDISICGTRGWLFEPNEPQDVKVMAREVGRLKKSLDTATQKNKIVFLHYPPIYTNSASSEIIEVLHEYNIKQCFYGHLHGNSIRWAVQGEIDDVNYVLLSADAIEFCPRRLEFKNKL